MNSSDLSLEGACDELGVSQRTVQRWRKHPQRADGRCGPRAKPRNALSAAERNNVLRIANSPEFRDRSPNEIVPTLADRGEYIASEATFYRVLRAAGQLEHRGASKPREKREVPTHVASGPCEVWSWDITYLRSNVRGVFFYLYLFLDVYSRKIVGWDVFDCESEDHSTVLVARCCEAEQVCPGSITLHSDNGGPMRGSTMLATLQRLGVVPSFSRPSVSNDNPFSESLFRTMKYAPEFPRKPFASLEQARVWVASFVRWYNSEHRHSGINFVTPDERHRLLDTNLLAKRDVVYERARHAHPERWSGKTRNWTPVGHVTLNRPRPHRKEHNTAESAAA
jgi:transposase InsO family protein